MINEYQLRLLPQQAANETTIKEFVSRDKGLDARTINHVRVLKRSIDARQRTIYINLKVRVYINEEPTDDEYEHTEYRDVSSSRQVIVVGAGPGGLFASLRLTIVLVRAELELTLTASFIPEARSVATSIKY